MPVTPSHRNLELKVVVPPDRFEGMVERARALACGPVEHLWQVDTYFAVIRGRLKLREFRAGSNPAEVMRGELIAYQRSDEAGSRWSGYEVVPVAGADVQAMLRALSMTHEELVTVDKQRLVVVTGHTRVHLDRVKGLGTYAELETVIAGQSDEAAAREHQEVITALGFAGLDVVAGSYSDLALASR